MSTDTLAAEARKRADSSALMGFFMAIIGFFTILYAVGQNAVSPPFLGWMLFLAAMAQFIFAFTSRPAGNFVANVVIAVLYAMAAIGLALFVIPHRVSLSGVVGALLMLEAIVETIIAFGLPPKMQSRAAFLFSALATLYLGTFVLGRGATSADWVIATLLGVGVLINGGARFAVASRIMVER